MPVACPPQSTESQLGPPVVFGKSYFKELGLLQFKIEKNDEAKKNLKKYLEIAKNPKDRSIIESYLN